MTAERQMIVGWQMYIILSLLGDGKQTGVILQGGDDGDGKDLERARPRAEKPF